MLAFAFGYASPAHAQPSPPPRIGQWARFEAALTNQRSYTDPFRDVTLQVTWTRPDGTTVPFCGFHDGGQTWRLRFMPDQMGRWRYAAKFSDGAPGGSGIFECVASDLPGMVTLHAPNPIWFGYSSGGPLLLRSFHVGDRFFAQNFDAAKRAVFLDWAQAQGYNTLSIASHYLNRDAPTRGRGWATPALWPLNPAAYREMEAILDDLAQRRMIVFPFAGFFGKSSNFPRDPADQELYLRYTLARIGCYGNILLSVAGPEPNLPKENYLPDADVTRLGRLIRRLDVFGHLLTVHNRTGADPYRDSDWSTFGTLQGPKTLDRTRLGKTMLANHHAAKPLYAQETLWPGNQLHPPYPDDDVRKHAFVLLCSATMINFADMAGLSSSGFSGTLDLADKVQSRHDAIKRGWDLFATLPYGRLRPRPDLVNAGHCLADAGRDYVVYIETPATLQVNVEGGPYAVEWINARDPAQRSRGGETVDGRNLTPPGDGDWLLRLSADRNGAGAPAARTHSVFTVKPDHTGTLLNGRSFLAVGLRLSNALISDAKTAELIANLDTFTDYGVNTISVFLQGSRFGDVRGYREEATLDPAHAARLGRIIEAADARAMVVLVGCLYHGTSKGWWPGWQQADAERAIAHTIRWLKEHDYRNVFVDVNNEHMAKFDDAALIAAGKAVDATFVITTGGKITPPNGDLSLHQGSPNLPDKYYIETEGTGGNYWGNYSKRAGLYDYINIGVYPETMKAEMLRRTDTHLDRGQGFLFASTWLQNPPPAGPNHTPGGAGTRDDPGVRWWLEHLKARVGPYRAPAAK